MKLGIAFNAFDGTELLEFAARSVRALASHVVVVHQARSNFGEPADPRASAEVAACRESGLVDEVLMYSVVHRGGHANEVAKRSIGMDLCAARGCTHFMSMDVDEVYRPSELEAAAAAVESTDADSSACMMRTYYGSPSWELSPSEDYYVPLIYKLDGRRFSMGCRWQVAADPTRRLCPVGRIKLFGRDEIEMHHLSYVRRDIRAKLRNSSARVNFDARVEEIARHHDGWSPGGRALLAGKEPRWYGTVRTDDPPVDASLLTWIQPNWT